MLLLLPPSESKRDGGSGAPLDVSTLAHPGLAERRAELVDRVVELARDTEAAMRALKLGPRLASEVERNRTLRSAPTMPAIDRYTGVLFDALDASTLSAAARSFAAEKVVVHSALFAFVGGLDLIPAYRLSHDSRLPGVGLRRYWRAVLTEQLAGRGGVIVDLRSEGYAALGPAPVRDDSVFVRVVSVDSKGRKRALNHFNKQAKGRFTRAFLESRPAIDSLDDLLDWAAASGFTVRMGERPAAATHSELELVA